MDKKTDWGKEFFLAVVLAVLIIVLMNFYCNWKSKDRLMMEDFEEKCEERGLEFSYYTIYPNSDSIKIGCKNPDTKDFEELFANASG